MKKSNWNPKKLELNRETIRILTEDGLDKVNGGVPDTFTCLNCPSSPTIC